MNLGRRKAELATGQLYLIAGSILLDLYAEVLEKPAILPKA